VFFRETGLTNDQEPLGAQGVSLTPGRSIAVDRNLHVYGTPFFISAELPIEGEKTADPFQRLMIAQDTGGAIIGPARADLYFGAGDEAASIAGRIKHNGRFVMLLPHELDPRVLKGDIPLPRARPTEQEMAEYKKNPPKDEEPAKAEKPAKAVATAKRADKPKPEATGEVDDAKPAKKRKSKIQG
jgi:membrane-bound lytic murein transglycosylase A